VLPGLISGRALVKKKKKKKKKKHGDALVQPPLQWKSNKYYLL
jgi:hypothetical protein